MSTPSSLRRAYLGSTVAVRVRDHWVDAADAAERQGSALYVVPAWELVGKRPSASDRDASLDALRAAYSDVASETLAARITGAVGGREVAAVAALGLTRREARRVGRARGVEALFEFSNGTMSVVGCSSGWTEIHHPGAPVAIDPPESALDLGEAVRRALGTDLDPKFHRAHLPGWVHEPGVGLTCPTCGGSLELFGLEADAKDGTPYRAMVFVCATEHTCRKPHEVPDTYRETAKAWRAYLRAVADADRRDREVPRRWVYCIELDDGVGERPDERPWIYVGKTSKTPEERFAEHRAGVRSSRWVRNHGVALRPDLYLDQPALRTDDEASAYERWKFLSMGAAGWPVKGGH